MTEKTRTVRYIKAGESASTSDPYGTINIRGGEYSVHNGVWGAETSQTVTVPDTDFCKFIVTQSSHNQSHVASYAAICKGSTWGMTTTGWKSIQINELEYASFNWSVNNYRPSGVYCIMAESWFSSSLDTSLGYPGGGELLIWLDTQGMVPGGSKVGEFGSYEVWYCFVSHHYICYHMTGQNSAEINLLDFINDALSRGYLNATWYLHDVEAGFEICSGGEGLMLESFNVSIPGTEATTSLETFDVLGILGIGGLMVIVIILIAFKLRNDEAFR
ncbi:MAG: hypothetical protein ACFFAX_00255 [Promethearchaeota archaeon]